MRKRSTAPLRASGRKAVAARKVSTFPSATSHSVKRARKGRKNGRPIGTTASSPRAMSGATGAEAAGAAAAWAAITGRAEGTGEMSKELVKWKPPANGAGRKVDEALARIRRSEIVIQKAEPSEIRRAEVFGYGKPGEVLDLPRVCALHDKPYSARYIRGRNGHFHYAQTVRVTEALYLSQYAECGNTRQELPGDDLCDETCPWCGASGFGAVRCGRCKTDICYGRTVSGYFRCRSSCGHEGKIVRSNHRLTGLRPFSGAGGFSVGG